MRRTLVAAALQLCVMAIATSPVAASIEHDPVGEDKLSGTRTTSGGGSGGLTGNGGYYGDDGNVIEIAWNITRGSDTGFDYHYEYTLSGSALQGGGHAVSNFILDISDDAIGTDGDATLAAGVVENAVFSEWKENGESLTQLGDLTSSFDLEPSMGAGNKMGFITGAVKFGIGGDDDNADAYRYEFDSNRSPVWGSFFVKNGGGSWPADLTETSGDTNGNPTYAANNALFELNDASSFNLDEKNHWIAVPNGVAPEPVSVAIWSLISVAFVGTLTVVRWRRRHGAQQQQRRSC